MLYPLKFTPILKERIWGGTKLITQFGKQSNSDIVGESWEVSDVEGETSIITNGSLLGKSLKECLESSKESLVGEKNYQRFGSKFPLLIKFIDACEDLSIQLHPNDELAKARHNSFGKSEMWYVMQADPDANLIVGFNQEVDSNSYLKHLEEKSLTEILNFEKVKEGDTFFIAAGRIHAIGAGVMVAEIQQTSDITYRIYDWDRVDKKGKGRELHNELAIDAIDFNMEDNFKVTYEEEENHANNMVTCPYFTTNFLPIKGEIEKSNTYDSFLIYMCLDGSAIIVVGEEEAKIEKGETVLVPAAIKEFKIHSDYAKLLEVYV